MSLKPEEKDKSSLIQPAQRGSDVTKSIVAPESQITNKITNISLASKS